MNEDTNIQEHEQINPTDFINVPLEEGQVKKKQPRRILHFSDGILEEYSTDEEDDTDQAPPEPSVDPKTLPWGPWIWHYMLKTAKGTLWVADTCGEKLAWFFGITTPKYQYAIDEFYRLKAEEERERKQQMKLEQEMQVLSVVDVQVDISKKEGGTFTQNIEKF
ncbi:hypothetical protein CHS0354_013805 [Potamilus streckersoni]|uniref:Uncharacterized protein n=1 Tax=Potamilus streckersoni TaxID=2493646 RepID=A0AAE0SGL1_9BIVA|nr:hypothetical protein CHS0354_013805 [Potamilus streckersoni]